VNYYEHISTETFRVAAKLAAKAVQSLIDRGMSHDALLMAEKSARYKKIVEERNALHR